MAVHADQGDAPERAVGVAVAAAMQPVPVGPAGGHRDRRDAAQAGEGPLGPQTRPGLSPGGDQKLPGGVHADAGQGGLLRRNSRDERDELHVQVHLHVRIPGLGMAVARPD